jgi:hypothetical protein
MEDASGVDLDWFWRGWFYDTDPVDISIDTVKAYKITAGKTVPVKMDTAYTYPPYKDPFENISHIRNREQGIKPLVDIDTTLRDFYTRYKYPTEVVKEVKDRYENFDEMPDSAFTKHEGSYVYDIKFSNKGGLVMPIIIQWIYADGSKEIERMNIGLWRKNEKEVRKTFLKSKKVAAIQLDPLRETADINEKNNTWNIKAEPAKFEVFKAKTVQRRRNNPSKGANPMQKAK